MRATLRILFLAVVMLVIGWSAGSAQSSAPDFEFAVKTTGTAASVPVHFANQPEAPAALVLASCDARAGVNISGSLEPGKVARFEVGVISRVAAKQIHAVRIGRVQRYQPRGAGLDKATVETPERVNECGIAIETIRVGQPQERLTVDSLWLYVAEVTFSDGSRWGIGSADEERELQEQLGGLRQKRRTGSER